MKVALAQLNYTIGDFEGNASKIIAEINRLKQAEVDLVVFSELSVTGYYPHDLLEKKEFIAKADDAVAKIAKHCHGIAALVGAPRINQQERGKQLFNSALFLADGEIKSSHNKTLLPTYDIFDEYRHFEPNREFSLVEYKGEKIAVTICEDLWDEQPTANEFGKDKLYSTSPMEELAKLKPDFVVNLSASPFSYNQEGWRKNVLIRKAKNYGIPILYCNQVGAQTELVFDGGSVYIDSTGEIVKELKYFEEDSLVLDTKSLGEKELQQKVDYIEKIHDALVLGIRDYFKKMGFRQATLGLSGGIDSAVTVVLAVRALGAGNVRVLLMPSKYSSDHSVNDARELAENLGIRYDVVNIQSAVDQFEHALTPLFEGRSPDVAEENIQARARGIYMMAISNKFGHILLNTTNKSECAVGYGTLYGDMNGGIAVLGDVYKMDVFKLSRFMNKDGEVIPENTIVKPPSAELRPDQKDTDSLPEYEDLDKMLFNYIELNKSPKEIAALGYDEAVVRRVIRMVNMNEYKRFQAAPILRVSSKAFGFGRKMPLVARY
ncbi:NAD+ synthase [Draconibacterium halophilum]|uniref:Glutamine-dependent NAD(+) synthetase n=1 Tax=Draconibacterium halophilum TaxID=2706887 RepID=A0A6C0RBI7_9BACT|nr:NAD+ synthase [Draconibacterium halophilum]QIA07292.1 NAD+ synthase [Draconibacterium halophilum]